MVDNNQDAFQLNCTFISGSVATGCILMLTGAFGTYSGAIPRTDTQGVLQHQVSGPVGAFSATVFDWEEDKRMGTVAFPVTSQATVIELLANRQSKTSVPPCYNSLNWLFTQSSLLMAIKSHHAVSVVIQ